MGQITMVTMVDPQHGNAAGPWTRLLGVESVSNRTCSIAGCPGKVVGWGWCDNHYRKWKKYGDPEYMVRPYRLDPAEAEASLRAAGLEPLVPYPGTDKPWPSRCSVCGSEVSPRLSGIRAGQGGCVKCKYLKHSEAQRGAGNPYWKGDTAEYFAVHKRVEAERGKAADHLCVDCGGAAEQWSYEGGCPAERFSQAQGAEGLLYSTDTSAYSPRCRKCHGAKDVFGPYGTRAKQRKGGV